MKRIIAFSHDALKRRPLKFLYNLAFRYNDIKKRQSNFGEFVSNYLQETNKTWKKIERITKKDFDAVVIGSDQVWNPFITGGLDPYYYGINIDDDVLKYTYAASSGDISLFDELNIDLLKKAFLRFDAVSVREDRLKNFVATLTNMPVTTVLDPTLTVSKDVLKRIMPPISLSYKYVLVYAVDAQNGIIETAKRVANLYNAKVLWMTSLRSSDKNVITVNAKPAEMLSLINNSECVVARSFHGTALSLVLEKDFYSIAGNNMSRVETILEPLGLTSRIIYDNKHIPTSKCAIDYETVTPILQTMKAHSINYINSIK